MVLKVNLNFRFCVLQLITVPEKQLHLYYKKGNVGNDARAEEQLVEWENVDDAIADFKRLFEELTGNDFEPWEREKKFHKKLRKFFPVDMVYTMYFSIFTTFWIMHRTYGNWECLSGYVCLYSLMTSWCLFDTG